jgi:hypothetical protein
LVDSAYLGAKDVASTQKHLMAEPDWTRATPAEARAVVDGVATGAADHWEAVAGLVMRWMVTVLGSACWETAARMMEPADDLMAWLREAVNPVEASWVKRVWRSVEVTEMEGWAPAAARAAVMVELRVRDMVVSR